MAQSKTPWIVAGLAVLLLGLGAVAVDAHPVRTIERVELRCGFVLFLSCARSELVDHQVRRGRIVRQLEQ